jgi:hypothetical protein
MKRNTGSTVCGLIPMIIRRESSRRSIANPITVGSKWPNAARHFCAKGRKGLFSSLNSVERSLGSTTKRRCTGGTKVGAQSSDNLAMARSREAVISERHSVVR